jgi:hypothetical protein
MTDYALGSAIRVALDQQHQTTGLAADPRAVEARLPQLVQADQQDLLPALSFLLRSRALASALAQPRGSDDGRIATRLLAEVQAQYSPVICQRLQGVIQGLVGLPQQPAANPSWSTAPAMPAVTTLVTSGNGRGGTWVVALLCFLIGVVGSGLLLVLWLQQQSRQPAGGSAPPAALPTPAPPALAPRAVAPAAPPTAAPLGTDAINAAVASIQGLYAALSAKDYATAASHYGPVAADQFDPTFFNQFERVTVADLRETSSTGSMVNFEGVVTFVYPNGDVQTESRRFTVDTRTTPPLITSSEFGQVLQPR